jgi:hypothetical protein
MTLVAAMFAENWPLLLGDLLISREAVPTSYQFDLPIQTVKYEGNASFVLTGLSQKICIVTPRLAVGWSGRRVDAQAVISEMADTFTNGHPVNSDEIDKFFRDLDFPEAKNVSIVGVFAQEDGMVYVFGNHNARSYNCRLFDKIKLAGSGADHFIQVLENVDSSSIFTPGHFPTIVEAVGKILFIAGAVLGEEVNTGAPLSSAYGGGLEIVYWKRDRFDKLGNITYLFWPISVLSADQFSFQLPLAINIAYVRDILLIRRIDFRQENSRIALFVIGPMNRRVIQTEVEEIKQSKMPDLNSGFLCHCFAITRPDAPFEYLVAVDKGRPELLEFKNEGNQRRLILHRDFGERLRKAILERSTKAQPDR